MIAKAELRYIRITPRKFRQIIPLVKGKNPEVAMAILANVKKNASLYAIDILKSAVANAKRVQGVEPSNLYISKLVANCGPQLKRFRAASMGRASTIRKRTSHIIVELDALEPVAQPAKEAHLHKEKIKTKETKTAVKETSKLKAQSSKLKAKART